MAEKVKCRLCGDIVNGLYDSLFKCRKHGYICGRHVRSGWLGGNPKCEACDKPVVRYRFNSGTGRWTQR